MMAFYIGQKVRILMGIQATIVEIREKEVVVTREDMPGRFITPRALVTPLEEEEKNDESE